MTPVTLAFAVLHLDNSASALGVVLGAELGVNVVCLLFGGVIADRLPRRAVMQTCYVIMVAVQFTMSASLFGGWGTIASMTVLGAISGGVTAFSMPANQGLIPQLVEREHLQQADSLMAFVRNGATFIGPILGTLLVVSVGPALALAIDGTSFLVATVLLSRVVLPAAAKVATSLFGQLREGWSEFVSRTWLGVIVLAFSVLNTIYMGAWVVIGPLIAKNTPTLGIQGWGVVLAAQAVGMLVMSGILLRVKIHRLLAVGMVSISLISIPVVMLGVYPQTPALAAAAFLAGCGNQAFSTGWTVAMMERVPGDVLSRVSSYDLVGSYVALPVGTILFGQLASHVAIRPLMITVGCIYAGVALATLLVPSVRNLTRLPTT